MSRAAALTIVWTTITLGLSLAVILLWGFRTGAYKHWFAPLRWGFLGLHWFLALFGAGLWIALMWQRGGWIAGVGQFALCAYVFKGELMALWPSASTETPPPPPTV